MSRASSGIRGVLEGDEVREILRETFFAPRHTSGVPEPDPEAEAEAPAQRRRRRRTSEAAPRPRPEHYKVICISLYNEDLARLDAAVQELKRRGFTKANRSAVLRAALAQLDLDRVPKGL